MLTALLGLESRSILENPNISLNDPRTWNEIFGGSTASDAGVSVSPKSSLSYPPAWQAVNLISGDIAALPLDLYRRRPDISTDAREKATDHPVQKLVRWEPYPGWHNIKFWRRMMVHALLWNNAYAVIQKDTGGNVISMLPLLPDRTKPEVINGVSFFVSEINGNLFSFSASQVLHIEGITIEGTADCETVNKMRGSLGLGLAAQRFASMFFRRGGRTGGILEVPAEMKKIAQDQVETGFRKMYEGGPDAAFLTFVARDNVKFHKAQFNAEEAQMQGTREEQALDASRIWNIPPHKLGIQNTVSYNSLEQENKSYHSTALVHWTSTIAAECKIKLLQPDESDLYYLEHNTDSLLGTDSLSAVTVAEKEIGMGTLTRNEWRAKKNRMPLEGGDEPILSQNLKTESEIGTTDQDDPFRSVLSAAIERGKRLVISSIRNRAKPKKAQAFCEWFDRDYISEEFRTMIRSAAEQWAADNGETAAAVVDRVTRGVVMPLRTQIEECLTKCTPETFDPQIRNILTAYGNTQDYVI